MNFKETIDDEINLDDIDIVDDALSLGSICIEDQLYTADQIADMLYEQHRLIISNDYDICELSGNLDISVNNLTNYINSKVMDLSTKHDVDIMELRSDLNSIYYDLSDDISNYYELRDTLEHIYHDLSDDISNITELSAELINKHNIDIGRVYDTIDVVSSELDRNLTEYINEIATQIYDIHVNDIDRLYSDLNTISTDLSTDISVINSNLTEYINETSNELLNKIGLLRADVEEDILNLNDDLIDSVNILYDHIDTVSADLSADISVLAGELDDEISTINGKLDYLETAPVVTQPFVTMDIDPPYTFENSAEPITLTISFDNGNYSFGPTDSGVSIESYDLKINETSIQSVSWSDHTLSCIIDANEILTGKNTINLGVVYSDGSIPKTNLGTDAPSAQIKSNTISAKCDFYKFSVIYLKYNSEGSILNIGNISSITELSADLSCMDDGSTQYILDTDKMQQIVIAINNNSTIRSVTVNNLYNGFPQNINKHTVGEYTIYEVLNDTADTNTNTYVIRFKREEDFE